MSRYLLILLVFVGLGTSDSRASRIDSMYYDSIRNMEYQLEGLSYNIINSPDLQERITSCYYFVQTLKKALRVPQSFEYEFTLLKTVSVLKPKDEKFRVFTWNLLLDSGKYMYFGAIQMNNKDSLKLFGLYDSSTTVDDPLYNTVDNRHWIGALYYQVHDYKYKGQEYYLLMGWDGEDGETNKKVIDILWFNEEGEPRFGAPYFEIDGEYQHRVIFQFAEQAVMLCRYEPKEKAIIYAHTQPTNPMHRGRYSTYYPDGTYDYFKFQKGFWVKGEMFYRGKSKSPHELRKY